MNAPAAVPRSNFVTIVAIVFLVLAGGATLIGVLQNLMVNLLLPRAAFDEVMANPPEGMPAFFVFLATNMRLVFAVVLALSATTLVASIGLLKRLAWARWLFIAIMALGIGWNLLGVLLQHQLISFMQSNVPPAEAGAPDLVAMMMTIRIASVVFALAFSALHAWIIWKLTRPEIAAEFRA